MAKTMKKAGMKRSMLLTPAQMAGMMRKMAGMMGKMGMKKKGK